MVGPPLGTRCAHGGPGLYPGNRPGRPPTGLAATHPGHHPHRPRRRPLGSPPHSTLLGSRLPQRPRHTGTSGGLGHAGQGHAELPPSPTVRRQPGRTAMAIRSPGDRAQAHRPHAQPRESEHANAGRTPTEGSGPASNAPLLQTPRPPRPATSSPTQASETKKGRTRPQPSQKSSDLPTPRTPPDPPGKPGRSILVILPPIIITAPAAQASSSSSLPPPAPPPPEAYPGLEKGVKVQQPFRNDHTGDWIWCEGTIQYSLRDPGNNGGPQIRVVWHRQKELDQGSSAPDKPEGHTLELTSAHPIRLRTDENKAHRGTKYTGELPPEWSQGLPPPRLPKGPPTGKKSPSPTPPP